MKNREIKKKIQLGAVVLLMFIVAGIYVIFLKDTEKSPQKNNSNHAESGRDDKENQNSNSKNKNENTTIWILGDSMAARHNSAEYSTKGWGDYLKNYLKDDSVVIRNAAASGASSISYTQLGIYSSLLEKDLQEGDYVIIQFGINDAGHEDRATDPYGDSDAPGSFQYVLRHDYIEPILKKGGHVILSTSVRLAGSLSPTNSDEDADTPGWNAFYYEHVCAMRKLAEECKEEGMDVLLLDTYDLTTELYRKMGMQKAMGFHGDDMIHYNAYGASYVAGLIAGELKKLGVPCCQDIRSIEDVME